jgi:adenylosuccinate synthase
VPPGKVVDTTIWVVGLGFGDEGKGTIVDFLARRGRVAGVVRYGGGPQATHHVVLPDGRWHGFSQLGAGTFVPGVATHLTRDVLVDPVSLLREDEVLREKGVGDALRRLTIDPRAAVVLPYHKMTGQLAELARGGERHGSVGLGVGEAARERDAGLAIRLEDARDARALRERLTARVPERLAGAAELCARAASPEAEERLAYFRRQLDVDRLTRILHAFVTGYASLLRPDEERLPALAPAIFEGAQGVLLDPSVGFAPFVTKTPVSPAGDPAGERLGVLRAYAHRHGPGPLPSEEPALAEKLQERHNLWNRWQGSFRVGPLDLVLARHAAAAARVDALALTCVDRLEALGEVRVVTAYRHPGPPEPWFGEAFAFAEAGGGVRIDALLPGAARHQAALTRVLGACRPAAELRVGSVAELVALLGSRDGLGVSVRIVSSGPTWQDKVVYTT